MFDWFFNTSTWGQLVLEVLATKPFKNIMHLLLKSCYSMKILYSTDLLSHWRSKLTEISKICVIN